MSDDVGGLKLPDICLTGEEKKPEKTSPRKPVPNGERTRARCVTGAYAATWPNWALWPVTFSMQNFLSTSSLGGQEVAFLLGDNGALLQGTYFWACGTRGHSNFSDIVV